MGAIARGARLWLPALPPGWFLGATTLVWTLLAYRHVHRGGWLGTLFKVGLIGGVYAVALVIGLMAATLQGLSEIPA